MKPNSPKFVAEVSSNHHRELARCLRFVETAAEIGCDAVKFQLFRVNRLFAPEILGRSSQHRQRAKWELPIEYLFQIARRCDQVGLEFGCTPFDLEAVEVLAPHVSFFKVSSYEILYRELIEAVSKQGRPVMLSTGMATGKEVAEAVQVARSAGCEDLTLLHCVSSYPCPVESCNLAALETMARDHGCPVGWSDHSRNPGVIARAVSRFGACVVEFHLDLDAQGGEYALGHCWLPQEISPVIRAVRQGTMGGDCTKLADGDGLKEPRTAELADREWRADPVDGLRPLVHVRAGFRGDDS
jgi:N-acetylneuraminate synthase